MKSIVVTSGNGSTSRTYNSVYNDPGYCKMVIVQDDDKFPSPRLCLLRKWPSFDQEKSFGFNLYQDLLNSTGYLKIEEVVRNSPAEAGGLRKNDIIIEINGDNIECKSFFRLIEILKDAFTQSQMELLVLAEPDAEWYRIRNISVNSNFPNIEYCETPYYGHILKPLDMYPSVGSVSNSSNRLASSQIEFHSGSGKLFRTTLVIDKQNDYVYKRVEELPTESNGEEATVPPLRPDGTYRHPGTDTIRIYYRPENPNVITGRPINVESSGDMQGALDSGMSTMNSNRKSGADSKSPNQTIGKAGESVDAFHDGWGDYMDKLYGFLDNPNQPTDSGKNTFRSRYIRLNDPNAPKRSRPTSPDNGSPFLNSGIDRYGSLSRTPLQTRSQGRYQSPPHGSISPTRQPNLRPPGSQQQQQQPQQQKPNNQYNVIFDSEKKEPSKINPGQVIIESGSQPASTGSKPIDYGQEDHFTSPPRDQQSGSNLSGSSRPPLRPIDVLQEVKETTIYTQITEKHEYIENKYEVDDSGKLRESLETHLDSSTTYLPDNVGLPGTGSSGKDLKEQAEHEFDKQQRVMTALVDAINTNTELRSQLRTVDLYKSESYFGYGIAFHTEAIPPTKPTHRLVYPYIEVEPYSPAEEAGLENGHRVVAVNGKYVNRDLASLEDIVECIEESYYSQSKTTVTVLDKNSWNEFMRDPKLAYDLIVSQSSPKPPQRIEDPALPRFCRLKRESATQHYGFDFKTIKNDGKHIATKVQPNLPASIAGLRDEDTILEVNGQSIEGMEHDAVIRKINENAKQVDLLVVADYDSYVRKNKAQQKPTETVRPAQGQEPPKTTTPPPSASNDGIVRYEVNPGKNSLGISLNKEGFITAIQAGSPSDLAGIKPGDKLVEINGINVEKKNNKEIVGLIKGKEHLVLGVKRAAKSPASTPSTSTPNIHEAVKEMIRQNQNEKPTTPSTSKGPSRATSESNLSRKSEPKEDESGFRVCNIIERPGFDGLGFSMKKNSVGPHQIASVEPNSPASAANLKPGDYILKVNDINVVGESYSRTIVLIKNEKQNGRLKLEVCDPDNLPTNMKNVKVDVGSTTGTVSQRPAGIKPGESIDNLKTIAKEITTDPGNKSPTERRSVSAGPGVNRASSSVDIRPEQPQIGANKGMSTSMGTGLQAVGQKQQQQQQQQQRPTSDRPRVKLCTIVPDDKGFGFTLSNKTKPKYSIVTVTPNSAADNANVKEQDVLIAIDDKNIRRMKFDKAKQIILDASKQKKTIKLLLISSDGYRYYKKKGKKFSEAAQFIKKEDIDIYSNSVDFQPQQQQQQQPSPQQQQQPPRTPSTPAQRQTSPSVNSSHRTPSTMSQTGSDLDNLESHTITVNKRKDTKLGISLAYGEKAREFREQTGRRDLNLENIDVPIITSVDVDSPADQAGLRQGDLIVKINNTSTINKTTKEIGQIIQGSGDRIELQIKRDGAFVPKDRQTSPAPAQREPQQPSDRLSRRDSYESKLTTQSPEVSRHETRMSSSKLQPDPTKVNTQPTTSGEVSGRKRNESEPASEREKTSQSVRTSPQLSTRSKSSYYLPADAPIPRLCRVKAFDDKEPLGFIVIGAKQYPGTYKINEVAPNSPAAHSGLQNQDIIIEVSGVNVLNMKYSEVISLIKEKKLENDLQLLVVDKATLEWYKSKKIPISSQIVPKMQYIETLFRRELDEDFDKQEAKSMTAPPQSSSPISSRREEPTTPRTERESASTTAEVKVATGKNSVRAVKIERKIYICTADPLDFFPSSE